jgi:hypothetical protein
MMSWFRMLFCSSLALACSGDVAELGDGPLTPSGASSAGDIGCESGIDCQGGQCQECFLETCFCDSSEDFKLPACVADGASLAGPPLLSADGKSLQFTVTSTGGKLGFYHWTQRYGLKQMPLGPEATYTAAGISADGRQVLLLETDLTAFVQTGEGPLAFVYRYDIESNSGSVISTGLLAGSAQMLPSGVVVGASRGADGARYLSRWSERRGLEVLSDVPNLLPRAATPDGSSIVGQLNGYDTPFLWSERGGLVGDLAAAIAAGQTLDVQAISADGSTIAGKFGGSSGVYRWSAADGLDEMPGALVDQLIAGAFVSANLLLSDDGAVLAGMLQPEKRPSEMYPSTNEGVPFVWTREFGFVQNPVTIDASSRLFMPGDGAMVVGGQYGWDLGRGASPSASSPPRRVQLRGGSYGPITGLSHDGNIAAGTALCGGVDAVLVQEHMRDENPF